MSASQEKQGPELYDGEYYQQIEPGSERSARAVVPLVIELVAPRSVVDVGCGPGTWLSVFREAGIPDVLGVDDAGAARQRLRIPQELFRSADLRKPLSLDREFDLAVSLEVAEHLPEEYAATFVASLARLAPVVLFSAAIPFQGGRGHVNEQWPEYWAKLFATHGFLVTDPLRRRLWHNPNVEYWYAQNMLLFVRATEVGNFPGLQEETARADPAQLALVHPIAYLRAADPAYVSMAKLLQATPLAVTRVAQRLFRRWLRHK